MIFVQFWLWRRRQRMNEAVSPSARIARRQICSDLFVRRRIYGFFLCERKFSHPFYADNSTANTLYILNKGLAVSKEPCSSAWKNVHIHNAKAQCVLDLKNYYYCLFSSLILLWSCQIRICGRSMKLWQNIKRVRFFFSGCCASNSKQTLFVCVRLSWFECSLDRIYC